MQIKYLPPGKRGASWYIRGRDTSGKFEYSTGQRTRRGAETWAQDFLAERARRRVPGRGETVAFDAAAIFYKAATPHLSVVDLRHIDAVAAHIGNLDCRLIVHATLVEAANALQPGRADATKNRKVMAPAAAVLHYAARNKWCEYQRVAKFWESRKSTREPVSDDAMRLLLANAEAPPRRHKQGRKVDYQVAYKRLLIAMLYELGLRLGDYLRVEWQHLDLDGAKLTVRIGKTDDWATLELSAVLVSMLANLPRKGGRLFPWSTSRGVYGWLKPLSDRLGVAYTPHQSRHALATAADAAQIPDKRAAGLGMWRDARSLHRYQHVRPEPIPGRGAGDLSGIRRKPGAK